MTNRVERAIARVVFSWPYAVILAATLLANVSVIIRQNARETMDPIAFLHVPVVIVEAGLILAAVWAAYLVGRSLSAPDGDLRPSHILAGSVVALLVFALIAALAPSYLLFFHIIAILQRTTLIALFGVLFLLATTILLSKRVMLGSAVLYALAVYIVVETALVVLSSHVDALAPLNDLFIINQLLVQFQTKFVAHSMPVFKYAAFAGALALVDGVLWAAAGAALCRRSGERYARNDAPSASRETPAD